jgi:hypothetical protein
MVKLVLSKTWRVAYRIVIILLCAFAIFQYFGTRFLYNFNSFYFPKERHPSEHIQMYVWLAASILLLAEAVFLFIFRRVTRPI